MGHQGVTALVVGEDPLLLRRDHAALLEPRDHAVHPLLEVVLIEHVGVAPAGGDRRLVADAREVGAGQARRVLCDDPEIDTGRERLAAGVHGEDVAPALQVGGLDQDLAVEAARAQERGIEVSETVRGAHHDDLVARAEPVELDEELVERLVLLAVEGVAARVWPTASSSSMKMIEGAFFRASSNSLRIRAAPSPANISTNAEALCA